MARRWKQETNDTKQSSLNSNVIQFALETRLTSSHKNAQNKDKDTPLHLAAASGNENLCKILLEAQVDKNPRDKDGDTPLHVAAHVGHLNICRALIESGAEKYPRNNKNKTPLDFAVQNNHKEVESYLRNTRKITLDYIPIRVIVRDFTLQETN